MREDAGQALARQWAMLRGIPRSPLKVTTAELESKLRDEGYEVSRRTIERDLHTLSRQFPLTLDGRTRPFGWSWAKDANFEFMPRLTTSQAVALLLAREHLRSLLPLTMSKDLAPVFDAATAAVASSGWKDWHKRTAVVPTTLRLLPPKTSPKIMETVQRALARKHAMTGNYRPKGSAEATQLKIHPLGLLLRGPVLYLVCMLFDYEDVRQIALHRLAEVKEDPESARQLAGFDFVRYVASTGARFTPRGPVRLVCHFDALAAEHLRETPLSMDQTWRQIDGSDLVEVSATVEEDDQLFWWLLAFGSQVTVIAPRALRQRVAREAVDSARQYEVDL